MTHRVTAGVAQASVLALLALPFVTLDNTAFSECGNRYASGYEVLTGFDFPSSLIQGCPLYIPVATDGQESIVLTTSGQVPHWGPNLALALLVVAVLVGVWAAWRFGRRGTFVRLGTAGAGIGLVLAAAANLPSSIVFAGQTVLVYAIPGPAAIVLALTFSIVVDGQALVRGYWSERKRISHTPGP